MCVCVCVCVRARVSERVCVGVCNHSGRYVAITYCRNVVLSSLVVRNAVQCYLDQVSLAPGHRGQR